MYASFGNEQENFYYIVRVGKTISPNLLIYLPFMVMAVHNNGQQYANQGLLVKQIAGHTANGDCVNNYLNLIPNIAFRITDEHIAALEP